MCFGGKKTDLSGKPIRPAVCRELVHEKTAGRIGYDGRAVFPPKHNGLRILIKAKFTIRGNAAQRQAASEMYNQRFAYFSLQFGGISRSEVGVLEMYKQRFAYFSLQFGEMRCEGIGYVALFLTSTEQRACNCMNKNQASLFLFMLHCGIVPDEHGTT